MKQILQNYKTGEIKLEELPAPALLPNGVVVRNSFSLVSAGTERATLEFAKQSLLGKARARPDLVKQVISKVRTDGLIPTYRAVMQRLDNFTPMGYSSAGEVVEVGDQVDGLRVGDLVSCAGSGYANHAEVIFVPKNLTAKLPAQVSTRHAAMATLGAIALQGIRRATLTPGEHVAVLGLGLVGQLTARLLHAYGFPVLGLDLDKAKVDMALAHGIENAMVTSEGDSEALAMSLSNGHGLDAVIVAAATPSNEPIELAGRLLREGGRVSAVGDVGLDVPRRLYYEKELDLRVSRSYGPGRYDPVYENQGVDYPFAHVRWTEQRNMEEFLRLISSGQLDIDDIVTHTFPFAQAETAYDLVMNNPGKESFLGVLLEYPTSQEPLERRTEPQNRAASPQSTQTTQAAKQVKVGLVGAGAFAQGTLLPILSKIQGVQIRAIAAATGSSASSLGNKYGCSYVSTSYRDIIDDEDINLVVIATRHNLHASIAVEALQAGKNVFVEKPLALTMEGLREVYKAAQDSSGKLTVGFNRRFAPLTAKAKEHFAGRTTSLLMQLRVSAGSIPADHWVHDPVEGGGRIIGEVCHFVDLAQFLCDSAPQRVFATRLPVQPGHVLGDDNVLVSMEFADGSRGSITYGALGADSMPKEFVELLGDGKSATLDNFRSLLLYQGNTKRSHKSRQDKGHAGEFQQLISSILEGHDQPIPLREQVLSSLATLCIMESLNRGEPVLVDLSLLDAEDGEAEEQPEAVATTSIDGEQD